MQRARIFLAHRLFLVKLLNEITSLYLKISKKSKVHAERASRQTIVRINTNSFLQHDTAIIKHNFTIPCHLAGNVTIESLEYPRLKVINFLSRKFL
ncbi:hypothetical protein M8J76_002774 [Diaphorina citri]|nr:hypothetical protein M8J76_002774 [Diaphorina citri]